MRKLGQLISFSILATGCTFILQTIVTHVLSPYEYGVFAKWLTDLNYIGLFFIFGLDNSIIFFSKEKKNFPINMGRNLISFGVIFLIAVMFVLFFKLNKIYYLSLFATIFCFAAYQSANAFNQAAEKIKTYGLFTFLRPFLILIPFLVYYVNGNLNLETALLTYSLTSSGLLIIILLYLAKKIKIKIPNNFYYKEYYFYGFKSMFNTLLAITLYTATIYCLDYLSSKEVVGYFFISAAISKLVWVVPDTVGNILYPKYLKIGNEYTEVEVMRQTFYYSQFVLLVNIIVLISFYAFGEFFLIQIFSSDYSNTFWPIFILLLGNQGMVFYKILGRLLTSKSNWFPLQCALAMGVMTNISLNFYLIPNFGLIGAAVATATSFWVCGLTVALSVKGSFYQFFNLKNFVKQVFSK